jgi:predicted Zn-dependent protease
VSCCQSLFRAGRADEARMQAVTLVRLKPDWSQGYQRLGEALLALQEFEEAEAVNFLQAA